MNIAYQTLNVSIASGTTGLILNNLKVNENFNRITGIAIYTKSPSGAVENRYLAIKNSTGDFIIEETPISLLRQSNRDNRFSKRFWSVDFEAKNQTLEVLTKKENAGSVLDFYIELRLERR